MTGLLRESRPFYLTVKIQNGFLLKVEYCQDQCWDLLIIYISKLEIGLKSIISKFKDATKVGGLLKTTLTKLFNGPKSGK